MSELVYTETMVPEEPEFPLKPDSAIFSKIFLELSRKLLTQNNKIIQYSGDLLLSSMNREPDYAGPDLKRIHSASLDLRLFVQKTINKEGFAGDLGYLRHELRTPLNQIIGYSEMIYEEAVECEDEVTKQGLELILSVARQMLVEINDNLVNSKFQITEKPQANGTNIARDRVTRPLNRKNRDNGKLLVVDDNESNRDMLIRRLEKQGYEVSGAQNGREALEMLRSENFELILLDIMMPEMDGIQTLEEIKADPDLFDLPVLMLSASDETESVVKSIEMGAVDYLPKPFNPVVLQARIGASLEKKRLRDKEKHYLQEVARVTEAAASVEAGNFNPDTLNEVSNREDALGQLARVFQNMARQVYAREQMLRQQVQELRIEIDQAKRVRQVADITENDYFKNLLGRAQELREKNKRAGEEAFGLE
jgi:DNA-binding response OmpR family regulator